MEKNELIQRLMTTFLEELGERVTELNSGLLTLEKDPNGEARAEQFKLLFRSVHSLKGAARSVSVDLIEAACHHLEDILTALRDQRLPARPELFSLLFKAIDGIEEGGMRLRDEQDLAGAPLGTLVLQLQRAAAGVLTEEASPQVASDETVRQPSAVNRSAEASSSGVETIGALATPAPVSVMETMATVANDIVQNASIDYSPEPAMATQYLVQPVAGGKVASRVSAAVATVRVPAEKLDSLLAQSGELMVARRRMEYRSSQLAELQDLVALWKVEWREVEKPLRRLLKSNAQPDVQPVERSPRIPRRGLTVLEQTGERLRKLERDLDQLSMHMQSSGRLLAQACDSLDGEVHRVRMLPFAEACGGLERAVRDLARAGGKEVQLIVQGEDVEMDRSVLEGLKDPLLHLVRNAVDHGLEPPAERMSAGKSPQGRIIVEAAFHGDHVQVSVADDGRGLNLPRIREKVQKLGLAEPQDDRDLARMIFLPGFSTAPLITDVSGRGVGLDVVLSQIESLHGFVDIRFQTGQGSRFMLTVPLTLTRIRTVLVVAGGQTHALMTSHVEQLVRFDAADVRSLGGRDVLLLGDAPIPIASLAKTLGSSENESTPTSSKFLGVILSANDQKVLFVVDEVLSEQNVVVKKLGPRIRRVWHVSGATLLPSGRVALVLNVANLIRTALARTPSRAAGPTGSPATLKTKKRLLVVEDSVTTRTLMKSILETAGYEVLIAIDGQHAWQLLPEAAADLVVSDVDMPRMDGFKLAEAIRSSPRFAYLPVVLVTARETDEDKARGIQVGANAFLIKSAFDQRNLLETISQLL